MIFVILWRILCNTLSLLTSIDAVPVIPPIILYLQSVTFTCAVNMLPAAVCRGVCIVAVIVPLAAPYISVSYPSNSMLTFFPFLQYSRIYKEYLLCLVACRSSQFLH